MSPDGEEIVSTDKYLVFKLIASRVKQPNFLSFQHRFKENNDMALIEDFNIPYSVSVKNIEGLVKEHIKETGQVTKGRRKIV